MFYCGITGKLSQPGESAFKLVTHVRQRTYVRTHFNADEETVNTVGHGTEIVREILCSREAYDKLMAEGFQPEVVKDRGNQ
jgi:hypothetical protein